VQCPRALHRRLSAEKTTPPGVNSVSVDEPLHRLCAGRATAGHRAPHVHPPHHHDRHEAGLRQSTRSLFSGERSRYGAAPWSKWSDRARRIELAITWRQHLNCGRVTWAGSVPVVLATRQSDPPGVPDLSLRSEPGCRLELSLGG
jgi:hypothetical protein